VTVGRTALGKRGQAHIIRGMDAAFEHVETTGELSWRHHVRRAPSFSFGWHYHPEFELTIITDGSGTRFVGDDIGPYGPGDVTLLGPGLPHTYVSATTGVNQAAVIQFRPDFLGPGFFARPEFAGIRRLLAQAARGLAFDGARADAVLSAGTVSPPRRTLALLETLATLAEAPGTRTLASAGYRPALRDDTRRRVDAVFGLLHAQYARPLPLAEVAEVAHLSPAAFSRFFRRTTGRTLTGYLHELRISAACRELAGTERLVADIAAGCGFSNLSNFNRRFRAITGRSPREYRAQFTR